MRNIKRLGLIVVSLLLISCSSNNDGTDASVGLSNLVGLWNSSENVNGKTDVLYTHVASDGAIIEYDYDGDTVDNGLDCYHITTGSVKPLSDNRFLVTVDMHDNKQFEVELELLDDGHALKILFVDENDTSKIHKSQIWTRESNAAILDNEPSCKAF